MKRLTPLLFVAAFLLACEATSGDPDETPFDRDLGALKVDSCDFHGRYAGIEPTQTVMGPVLVETVLDITPDCRTAYVTKAVQSYEPETVVRGDVWYDSVKEALYLRAYDDDPENPRLRARLYVSGDQIQMTSRNGDAYWHTVARRGDSF